MSGKPITEIQIATSKVEEDNQQQQGFMRVDGFLDVNSTASLWYKSSDGIPITRIQFSYTDAMKKALIDSGFKPTRTTVYHPGITMWYRGGSTVHDIPITDLKITNSVKNETNLYKEGWEQLRCDLYRWGQCSPIYVWVKRSQPSYISSLQCSLNDTEETALFNKAFVRHDEDLDRGLKASSVFLFHRRSKEVAEAITDIDVSTNGKEEGSLTARGFLKLNYNLNRSGGDPVFLWYKNDDSPAISNIFSLVGQNSLNAYLEAGCLCIQKNLNSGNGGTPLYIAYKR